MGYDVVDMRGSLKVDDLVDISEDDDASVGRHLLGRPILGLLVPICNDTPTITFEISIDGGSNWYDLHDSDGSTDPISITGGAAAFFVSSDDLSPLAGYCGRVDGETKVLVRAVFSAAQTSDRTLTWLVVG